MTSTEEQRRKARERQRLRRMKIKQDKKLHEQQKKKERERWNERVKEGKVLKIADMEYKDKKKVRETRRKSAAKYRSNLKSLDAVSLFQPAKKDLGRKKKNLNRSSVVRENHQLQSKVKNLTRQVWRYKQRVHRAVQIKNTPSPRAKVNAMLGGKFVHPNVRKKLVFAEAVTADLASVKKIKSNKVKQVLGKVLKFNFIKKYKMIRHCKLFMFKRKTVKKKLTPEEMLTYDRKIVRSRVNNCLTVSDFFNRDDVSAVCPGKGRRNYAKLGGILKRKRIMRGTLTSLYQQFVKEDINRELISFSLFCRLKPFYIVSQNVDQRRTCLCQTCENFNLLCFALHSGGAFEYRRGSEVARAICCENITNSCAERNCNECKDRRVDFLTVNNNKLVNRSKWVTVNETREGLEKPVKRTIKRDGRETVMALREEFLKILSGYLGHYFRFNHQHNVIRKIKNNVQPGELVLHMDFSENWCGKYGEEIQSVYYGGSREQIILHQGVGRTENHQKSFCTLSKSPQKDAAGIGAHLRPVLNYFFAKEPGISKLHLASDSPTTQYRNKETFFMVTAILTEMYPQLTEVYYHFTEAGHGKNESDGVGAGIKTLLDLLVAAGIDVATFEFAVQCLKEKAVKTLIASVTHEDILDFEKKIPKDLETFKGTMKVHYYSWCKENKKQVYFSSVSCADCSPGSQCSHFGMPGSPWKLRSESLLEAVQLENPEENTDDPEPQQTMRGPKPITVDCWAAVMFNNFWYPGLVDHCTKNYVWVNFMVRHEKNNSLFLWPEKVDKHRLSRTSVIYVLNQPPVPVSRQCFSIPELELIDELAAKVSK